MAADVESKVKEIIVNKLGVEESQITPSASFINDLGADSLDTVELIMEFEKSFNVTIDDADAEKIQTVGDDLILRCPTRYGIVFQKADDRLPFGSHQAFGHDGAGGSVGVADPWHGIAYAWIPRRMSCPGGGDLRGLGLADVVRGCLTAQH